MCRERGTAEEKQNSVLISIYTDNKNLGFKATEVLVDKYQEAPERCPAVQKNNGALSHSSPYARHALTTDICPRCLNLCIR